MPQTIICVDDRVAVRRTRSEFLREAGFAVMEAGNAADIVKEISEVQPALILLAIGLERATGLEICRQLKANSRTAPIPVLHISSSTDSHGDYPASLESGADGYLHEPFPPEVLRETITVLVRASAVERSRAANLGESERIYRAIGDSIDYGVWVCSSDGRNTYASDSFLDLVGLTQQQCSNLEWSSVLHPDDADRTIAAWKECIRTGQQWDIEFRLRGVDGKWHPVLARGVPVRDDHGSIICWAGINLDIGALKRIEQSLRDSEQRERTRAAELEAIMDAAPAAIFIAHDPECRHMTGNRMAHALLRTKPGSNLSKSAPDNERLTSYRFMNRGIEIHPNDLPVQRAAFSKRPVRNCELDVAFEDGDTINLLGDAVPMLDENGRVRGSVGVLIDITERKRADDHLRQSQKLESLGLMAGGIAHDFNNLLVGVIGNASLAQSMVSSDHPAADLMARVVATGEKAAHLTRQMLAYSGRGSFAVETVNLSNVVSEMHELIKPSLARKIALRLELDANLPSIKADRGQLEQVIMNLVLNASEAIGHQSGQVTIETGVQTLTERGIANQRNFVGADLRPGQYVYVQVSDTGCGMDEATQARVFDPFFSTKFTGRGLGLSAVSGILRGHKGAARISSTPGGGTCFRALLPATTSESPASGSVAGTAAVEECGKILIVDDEEMVRTMAKLSLERSGFNVLTADSGRTAIDLVERHCREIQLVVLDISMPGMSGEEVLQELCKIRPDIRVVVSSGYSEAETMTWLRVQRVSGFIQKPYTASRLVEQVKASIQVTASLSPDAA